jgi:hypothetical protein
VRHCTLHIASIEAVGGALDEWLGFVDRAQGSQARIS